MDAGRAVLSAADIEGRAVQVNLLPANVDQLANPQGMTEGHQDQQPIAARVSALTSGSHQLVESAFLARPPRTVDFPDFEGLNWITVFIGKFPPMQYELST